MKSPRLVMVLALAVGACTEPGSTVTLPVFDVTPALGVVANGGRNAAVQLSGGEEVPARETSAHGTAVLRFRGDELSYELIVAEIENVVQAHIHIGAAGANGPISVFLYGLVASGGGPVQGLIASGTLTEDNFVGPLLGRTMDDLRDEILAGNAYVNVHTNDGVAPTNTGPGDFPGGEIRAQVQ